MRTWSNGQVALGFYAWDDEAATHLPFALNVLTLGADGRITDVCAFVIRTTDVEQDRDFWRWVDQRAEAGKLLSVFERFGLPERLD